MGEDSVTDDPALGLILDDGSPQHSRVSDPLIRKDVFCHPCRANGVLFCFFFFQTLRKDPLFPQIRSSSEVSWATHETHLGKPESSTATHNSTGSLCGRNNETPYQQNKRQCAKGLVENGGKLLPSASNPQA